MLKEEYLKFAMLASVQPNILIRAIDNNLRKTVAISIKGHENIWFNIGNYTNDSIYIRNIYYLKDNVIYSQYAYAHPLFMSDGSKLKIELKNMGYIRSLLIEAENLMREHTTKLETLAGAIYDSIGYEGKHGLVFGARYRNVVIPMNDRENLYLIPTSFKKDYIEPWSLWLVKDRKPYWVNTQHTRKSMDRYIKDLPKKDPYDGEYNLPVEIFSEIFEKQLKNNCKDEAIVV